MNLASNTVLLEEMSQERVSTRAFIPFKFAHGLLSDMSEDTHPTQLSAWCNQDLNLADGGTHFGFVFEGSAQLESRAGRFTLSEGMYFSISGPAIIRGASRGIVMTRLNFGGFFQIGGPIEQKGRLKYIDGCTDSLLIPPVMLGDACLNLLHFSPHIHQTQHTHPSMRVGMVARGRGRCITPNEEIVLEAGMIFVIPANKLHSFSTDDDAMTVIAYHPDSDYGPTHENHPMINRTIVNGVSASHLDNIRTKHGVD